MKADSTVMCITNLSVYHGEMSILQPLTLGVRSGEVLALIGPSRSGKSVLLRALHRMPGPEERIEGTVLLYGRDLYKEYHELEARRKVAYVFTRANIFPGSILSNVTFGIRMQGEKKRDRLEQYAFLALQKAGLWEEVKDRLSRPASRLSEGQQQRLCIARALALSPDILLLDNVSSALDPIATGRIEEILVTLKNEMPIILATQSVQQASRVSDSTAFLLDGSLIEYGRTEELYIHPQNSLTADYLSGRYV